jgi:glycosyltransferase involved in cell wall biosynthesis
VSRNPLVSVIIPTYNRSGIVHEAIESVLSQTYDEIELIVVDDGSTDDTSRQMQKYGDRIRILTQENAGPAAARNRGISNCHGELIAFLDSDDLWTSTKVQRQVSLLQKTDNSTPCCLTNIRMEWNARTINSFDNSWLKTDMEEGIWLNVAEVIATRFVLFNQAVMIRRDALERVGGFDESLRLLEDTDLAMRLSFEGPWAFIKEPLVIWRETSGSCYQEARLRELVLMEGQVKVLETNVSRLNGEMKGKAREILRAESKRARRELKAAQMSRMSSPSKAATGRLLREIERWRRAAFRRSPWFPKMKVQAL